MTSATLPPSTATDRAVRVAVCGKGGSGKTALVALLAQELRRAGVPVLAVDLDTNPGLAVSLGLGPDQIKLPAEAVEADEDATYGYTLRPGLGPAAAVERYAAVAADGTRVVGFGDADCARHGLGRTISAVRAVHDGFDEPGWVVLGDIEAGPATPFEGFLRRCDLALVLVEATRASCWAARRLLSITAHDGVPVGVVVSRARSAADERVVREQLGLEATLAVLPEDPALAAAERTGAATAVPDDAPVRRAVADLAARIRQQQEVST